MCLAHNSYTHLEELRPIEKHRRIATCTLLSFVAAQYTHHVVHDPVMQAQLSTPMTVIKSDRLLELFTFSNTTFNVVQLQYEQRCAQHVLLEGEHMTVVLQR